MPASYADLVVVDAFDGAQVPRSLVSGEFLDELARIGRNRRMVIYNVTDSAPFRWTRRLAAGLAERWRHLVTGTEHSVWKGRRFGNLLLAASAAQVDMKGLRRDAARQPFPYRWAEGRELRSWIGGAEPFTDADAQDSPLPSGSKLRFFLMGQCEMTETYGAEMTDREDLIQAIRELAIVRGRVTLASGRGGGLLRGHASRDS